MSLKFEIKIYCSNCKKGLHNVTVPNENFTEFELKERRCKEEFTKKQGELIKCQCLCLTHYQYRGIPVPIGNAPPKSLTQPTKELGYDESIESLNEQFRELAKTKQSKIEVKEECKNE